MRIKSLFSAGLGIATEVLYALSIMLAAFFICVGAYLYIRR